MDKEDNLHTKDHLQEKKISRAGFMKATATLVAAGGILSDLSSCNPSANKNQGGTTPAKDTTAIAAAANVTPRRVAADPSRVPSPLKYSGNQTHQVTLVCTEVIGEIVSGKKFRYLTFNEQVPAPMIRVRQGDTIDLTITNPKNSLNPHSVDFHAVYGTGGGSPATMVAPGETKKISFKLMYPGAFIYHCAAPGLDYHISSGMFGLILVEPPEGLTPVDHEFYFGQNEIYTKENTKAGPLLDFDYEAMKNEDPTYVVLNGESYAITDSHYGSVKVKKGERARLYFVNGGPNLISSFHPIGNVWTKAWRAGAIANVPEKYIQTIPVSPGSCAVLEMEFPVPETIKLVDHSLSRVVSKGFMGMIEVSGDPEPGIFDTKA